MKWVSYTRSISSRIGEENPSNTIAEQNERIAQYLKKRGCSISEKYSDRKRTAEAAEGFDRLVQDGMARKFDAVVVDSIFRCGRTLPFAIETLQRTFYPLGIQFAVVEDDFCSADKTTEEVAEYFNGKTIDKIRSEFITNRQNQFKGGTLTHRQAKYGYALSEDRRSLVLNPESAQVVKLIFQMYLEDMKIPEIARALDVQRSISTNPDGKEKKIKNKNQVAGFNHSLDFEKSTLYRKVYADTGKGKARIGGSGDCFRDGISESPEKVGIYEVAFEKKGPKKTKSALQKNL